MNLSRNNVRFAEKTRVSTCGFGDRIAEAVCGKWFSILNQSHRVNRNECNVHSTHDTSPPPVAEAEGCTSLPSRLTSPPPPFDFQQTVLAGFVVATPPTRQNSAEFKAEDAEEVVDLTADYTLQVVSLGVGTKFIHPENNPHTNSHNSNLAEKDDSCSVIYDMHAESLAQRGLQRYLLDQMEIAGVAVEDEEHEHERKEVSPCEGRAAATTSSIFDYVIPSGSESYHTSAGDDDSSVVDAIPCAAQQPDMTGELEVHASVGNSGRHTSSPFPFLRLKPGVTFHLYTSSAPCGNSTVREWTGNKGDKHYTEEIKSALFGTEGEEKREKVEDIAVSAVSVADPQQQPKKKKKKFSVPPVVSNRWLQVALQYHGGVGGSGHCRQQPLTPLLAMHPVLHSVKRAEGQFSATYKYRMYNSNHDDTKSDEGAQQLSMSTLSQQRGGKRYPPWPQQPLLCCSDLIALWNALGIQGRWALSTTRLQDEEREEAIDDETTRRHDANNDARQEDDAQTRQVTTHMSPLLPSPIYMTSLTVGRKYSFPALQRAVCCRLDLLGRNHSHAAPHSSSSSSSCTSDVAAALQATSYPARIKGGDKKEKAALRALLGPLGNRNARGGGRAEGARNTEDKRLRNSTDVVGDGAEQRGGGAREGQGEVQSPHPPIPVINHPLLLCTSVLMEPPSASGAEADSQTQQEHTRALKQEGEGAVFEESRCVVWWRRQEEDGMPPSILGGSKNGGCSALPWDGGAFSDGKDTSCYHIHLEEGYAECLQATNGRPSPWPVPPPLNLPGEERNRRTCRGFNGNEEQKEDERICDDAQNEESCKSYVSDRSLARLSRKISENRCCGFNLSGGAVGAMPNGTPTAFDYDRYEELLLSHELLLRPISTARPTSK